MKREIFGREGERLFVNSADSQSCDFLEEHLPQVSANGSIDIGVLHTMICEQEQVKMDDLVIGRIAIRKDIENCGRRFRTNHQTYTKRHANNLIEEASFIRHLQVSSDYSIPWTITNSLDHFVELQVKLSIDAHRKAAIKKQR